MILNVEKEEIIEGLQTAAAIIPPKTGAAYLRSIWLKVENNKLGILSTDSSIEFIGNYSANISEEGLIGVQGKAFVELLKKLPNGTLSFKAKGENSVLIIEQGRKKYKLPTQESSWFQNFSEFYEENAVEWSADFLQELIDRISFCISDDESSEGVSCFLLKPKGEGKIEACGLNGHQFALQSFLNDALHDILPANGILIQKKYLNELKKWLANKSDIQVSILEKRIFLRSMDKKESMSLPLADFSFPDYTNFLGRIYATDISNLIINRPEVIDALGRLSIFNNENNRCTYFDLTNSDLVLSCTGQDVGSATEMLDMQYQGDIKKIAFPTRNLIDIFGHFNSEKLTMIFTGTEGCCGIKGENDQDYVVIIMPMKIVEETFYNEEEVDS
ncbi:DNA polymerase III subunit beta [Desulfovibrio litoralis]|uniref:Beta sliding clamp n=1 Tax=Desulfovibrio litoralis DSM 11393 TaxID=1121455 RepID=A0A1M7TJ78_9BACT|nr:DNA polymerase III subunit beta [Desulfovibrio litoralis]SHN70794.1 DNA polymerase III, beta subunit [Desulfovibrio litoralis DSM 11393]